MSSVYATSSSSSDDDTSDAQSKRYEKPLTKRAILKKINELKIQKQQLKKKKQKIRADFEKNKQILADMGFSNIKDMFEEIERLADDRDPRIRAYTLNFIDELCK